MWGPPSSLNTSISKKLAGGTLCIKMAGGGKIAINEDGVGGRKQKSTLSPHN